MQEILIESEDFHSLISGKWFDETGKNIINSVTVNDVAARVMGGGEPMGE
jgi:hypothetical protein